MTALQVLALAFWVRAACADRAQCPTGHDLRMGIRSTGDFECWPTPVGNPEWDGTFQRPDRSVQPRHVTAGRIYCTNGARPIVIDYRTVGCTRYYGDAR